MKRLVLLLLLALLVSLACQALVPGTSAATHTAVSHGSLSVKSTRAVPSPTLTPTLVATSTPAPTPKPITCADDGCLDSCLQRIEKAIPQVEYEPLTGAYAENEIDMNLVYYDIKVGQLGEPQYLHVPGAFKPFQQDTNAHLAVWRYASSLLPADDLKWIDRFEIFKSTNYSGWVSPTGRDQNDRSHWTLGIELAYAQDPVGITYTLIHEYGHLISLNTDQIPAGDCYYSWSQNPAVCKQLLSPDGCITPDSYINQFYQQFWSDLLSEWEETVDRPIVNTPD
ncbi:MAG: hypothetical protein ACM3XO_10950 [Bacteroidota bacterium]